MQSRPATDPAAAAAAACARSCSDCLLRACCGRPAPALSAVLTPRPKMVFFQHHLAATGTLCGNPLSGLHFYHGGLLNLWEHVGIFPRAGCAARLCMHMCVRSLCSISPGGALRSRSNESWGGGRLALLWCCGAGQAPFMQCLLWRLVAPWKCLQASFDKLVVVTVPAGLAHASSLPMLGMLHLMVSWPPLQVLPLPLAFCYVLSVGALLFFARRISIFWNGNYLESSVSFIPSGSLPCLAGPAIA